MKQSVFESSVEKDSWSKLLRQFPGKEQIKSETMDEQEG